jgi:hypothetical protein
MGHPLFDVESIARRILAQHGGVIDEGYARSAFAAILAEAQRVAKHHRVIAFETTGASDHSEWFLQQLRATFSVTLVRVRASAATCTRRMSKRDPGRQIVVDPQLVDVLYARTEALDWPWDLVVDNDPALDPSEIARVFAGYIAANR